MARVFRVTPPAVFSLLLYAVTAASLPARAEPSGTAEVWGFVARHLPAEAAARLKKLPAGGDREAAFLRAIVLMDTPPISDSRLHDVIAQLSPLASGEDEIAGAAAYFIGRIYQLHLFAPDCARAAACYEALSAKQPGTYWAQLAAVKLALLKLYVAAEPSDPAARLAEAERLASQVTAPELQRDLQLILGRACIFHHQPGVLPHLLAADAIGGLLGMQRADLLVQIAELSRREGKLEQAGKYFRQFIAENEVDPRAFAVQMKLQEITRAESAVEGSRRP